MDKRYAVVDSYGNVINIVLWNGGTHVWQPPDGCAAVLINYPDVTIGWKYSNGNFYLPQH